MQQIQPIHNDSVNRIIDESSVFQDNSKYFQLDKKISNKFNNEIRHIMSSTPKQSPVSKQNIHPSVALSKLQQSFGATEPQNMLRTPDKSIVDFFDNDQSDVRHFQVETSEEQIKFQNGNWLQKRINEAKPNEVLHLQSITYKFESLFIKTPITLLGQPETIFEVDGGSIFIDFQQNPQADDMQMFLGDDDIMVPSTPTRDQVQLSQKARETLRAHPLNKGTPLTIKKSRVARIQECEIRYNRTKAVINQQLKQQQQRDYPVPVYKKCQSSPPVTRLGTEHNLQQQQSHDISTGVQTASKQGRGVQFQLNDSSHYGMNQGTGTSQSLQMLFQKALQTSNEVQSPREKPVSCFIVEQNSFLEVKDCFIKSISDKLNFDQQLDQVFRNQGSAPIGLQNTTSLLYNRLRLQQQNSSTGKKAQKQKQKSTEIHKEDFLEQLYQLDTNICDYCFSLNQPGIGRATEGDYAGLVSLTSTTVQYFMFGVYCGSDAVLASETSSFIMLRSGGYAIKGYNPKQLKFMNGSIQKCEANGVHVILDDRNLSPQIETLIRAQDEGQLKKRSPSINQKSETEVLLTDLGEHDNQDIFSCMISRLTRKIYIENNRFVQVQGCPILIEGPPMDKDIYFQYFIKVKDNRISNCGLESKLYAIPGASDSEKEREQKQVKRAYEKIGGQPKACINIRNMNLFELSCFRNTISKGSGSGITLQNVKGHKEDMTQIKSLPITEQEALNVFERCIGDQQRITVIDNYIIDISEGYGMVIDGATCHMELNQLKKNALGGLLITTTAPVPRQLISNRRQTVRELQSPQMQSANSRMISQPIGTEAYETARSFVLGPTYENDSRHALAPSSLEMQGQTILYRPNNKSDANNLSSEHVSMQTALRLSQIKHYCSVTMDNSTSISNQRFGIGVLGFYGTVTIIATQVSENETDGIVLSQNLNESVTQRQSAILEDEAGFLDLNDCTSRSNLANFARNRSQQPYDQAIVDCLDLPDKHDMIAYDRPFLKQAANIHLFKCYIQQNRQDGIKTVDMGFHALGCTIQGNLAASIRCCHEDKADGIKIFSKGVRNNGDQEMILKITLGYSGARYKTKVRIDSNLPALLQNLLKVQMLAHQVEMVQMTQQEPQVDQRATIQSKNSEQKLIHQLESQKSIIEQRDSMKLKIQRSQSQTNCYAFFKSCFCTKNSSRSPNVTSQRMNGIRKKQNKPAESAKKTPNFR